MNLKALKLGFILGLITREELLKWSDSNMILGKDDSIFLELSSITKNHTDNEIINILKQNSQELDRSEFRLFHTIVLSFFYKKIKDWKNIQKKLITYYESTKDYFDESDFEFWSRLKDDYLLRRDGFTGCMRNPKELKQYFKSFKLKDYQGTFLESIIDNFPVSSTPNGN